MLGVDVQLDAAVARSLHGDLHATEIVRVQLDAQALAGQAIQVGLMGDLVDDFGWLDVVRAAAAGRQRCGQAAAAMAGVDVRRAEIRAEPLVLWAEEARAAVAAAVPMTPPWLRRRAPWRLVDG